jgi:hypothetical protein
MSPLRYVKMVAWSFFGIRRKADYASDVASTKPMIVVAVAVAMTALLVGVLSTAARLAARTIS